MVVFETWLWVWRCRLGSRQRPPSLPQGHRVGFSDQAGSSRARCWFWDDNTLGVKADAAATAVLFPAEANMVVVGWSSESGGCNRSFQRHRHKEWWPASWMEGNEKDRSLYIVRSCDQNLVGHLGDVAKAKRARKFNLPPRSTTNYQVEVRLKGFALNTSSTCASIH